MRKKLTIHKILNLMDGMKNLNILLIQMLRNLKIGTMRWMVNGKLLLSTTEFKGEWKAKQIPNPEYKGPWVHPMIANPEFVADENLYAYDSWGAIGLDLWQVKSGSVFDNFLLSDDIESAIADAKAIIESSK